MEYKVSLENLLAAAYLSGAAEGLRKASELTPDDIHKNLEDLKHLRRKFLERAESEGYHKPVHHIEEAKLRAYELLREHTRFPNTSVSKYETNLLNTNVTKAVNAVTTNTKVNTVPMLSQVAPPPSTNAPPVLSLGGKRRVNK